MNDRSDGAGSNTGLVIVIVVLVLAVPCCGGLALVGAALFGIRSVAQPAAPQVIVQPVPPQLPPVAVPPAQPEAPPVISPEERGGEEASVPAETSIQ